MKKYETRYRVIENSSYNDFNSELPYTIVTVDYDPSTKKIRQRGFNAWTDHKCDLFTTRKLAENWFVSLVNNSFVTAMKAENIELKKKLEKEKNTSAELTSLIDAMRNEDPKITELENEIERLNANWNSLCNYLGEQISKYGDDDLNGNLNEILSVVNQLRKYDASYDDDKYSLAIKELIKVRDWCYGINENNKKYGFQKEPNLENCADIAQNRINELYKKIKGKFNND